MAPPAPRLVDVAKGETMDGNLELKARELALQLLEIPSLKRYREAKRALDEDQEAQALLSGFMVKQRMLYIKQQENTLTLEDIQELRELQGQISNHPAITAFFQAQEEAQSYIREEVNPVLSELLGIDFGSLAGPAAGSC